MRTILFLMALLVSGNLFAQSIPDDAGNAVLKKFNDESKLNSASPAIKFTENKGQIHDQNYKPRPDVLFGAMAGNMAFHLKKNGVSYQLTRVDSYKEVEDPKTSELRKEIDQQTIYRIDLTWLNANSNLQTTTDQMLEGYNNYYLENCPNGALNVKSYTGVTLHNLYNGINLHYYEKEGELKHDYIIAPGADYKQIQVKVDGATVDINEDGSLTLTTPLGKVQEGAPMVYQNGDQLKAKWVVQKEILSFEIENYNPGLELIIDPVTRAWGTYYGGNQDDIGLSCTTDAAGNVYMTGYTASNSGTEIATAGAHQTAFCCGFGTEDAFLVKFNSSGVRLWGTYYGGTEYEYGNSCVTDATGNIYMAGITISYSGIATPGAHQVENGNGSDDAFLVKFNSSGVRQWATYYGGDGIDHGISCATDASGNVYLSGYSVSNSAIATMAAHQTVYAGGGADAFLVKFNSNGVRQWATYYGGNGSDNAYSCATDANGNVYMTGSTKSGSGTVIATAGAHQTVFGGGNNFDAFLVKFDSNGVRQWGTYYGGTESDIGRFCATEPSGGVYVTGLAGSYVDSVIATEGAHQTTHGGQLFDAFLVRFNSSGVRQWGTYYGGTEFDEGRSCSADPDGNVYMTGWTTSNTAIATAEAYQMEFAGAYLAKFNSSGVRLWGTYYGSHLTDKGYSCTADASGNVYMAGWTIYSTGEEIATAGAHQPIIGGGESFGFGDAYLVKFSDCIGPTTASENQTACDSYTWALNGATYTDSGTYTHVGANAVGCDLTTTLNLTINSATFGVDNQIACESFTWIDGNTYTESNSSALYILPNAAGCDSTVTLNLTINSPTSSIDTHSACESFTWIDGNTYTESNNSATYVLTNAAGCDSIITLNLNITQPTSGIDTQSSCESFTWIDGTTYTESNNSALYILSNTAGCDSTVTLNLTINSPTSSIDSHNACESFTWIDGNTYTESNNSATFILTNEAGCDSLVTLHLNITQPTASIDTQSSCESFTWIDGNTYNNSNNSATYVLTNTAGCDSIITLNFTLNAVDVSTSVAGQTITSNQQGASYQWINCSNGNAPIAGQTGQSFTPTATGNYAVIVTLGDCSETSDCTLINVVGLYELESSSIRVYPNPTTGQVTINPGMENSAASIKLFNALGQTVLNNSLGSQGEFTFEIEGAAGIYLLEIETQEGKRTRIRVVKE